MCDSGHIVMHGQRRRLRGRSCALQRSFRNERAFMACACVRRRRNDVRGAFLSDAVRAQQ